MRETIEHDWERLAAGKELECPVDTAGEDTSDRFYKDLSFGTAGMRGRMGPGTNRMNRFTVARAARALAIYLKSRCEHPRAAVAYDTRLNSEFFARTAAAALAAGGVRVEIFPSPVPTPVLSYAVRRLGSDAGIVITASHNPKQYNGLKAYGPDGTQILSDVGDAVEEIQKYLDLFDNAGESDFSELFERGDIEYVSDRIVEDYFAELSGLFQIPDGMQNLSVAYTPLCGTGAEFVPRALWAAGVTRLYTVKEQSRHDGNFPTCPLPSPDLPETLERVMRLARENDCDIAFATDPDADRLSAAVRTREGEYKILSGNSLGVLILDFLTEPGDGFAPDSSKRYLLKSIVSAPLAEKIAEARGLRTKNLLTGFKYFGEFAQKLSDAGECPPVLAFEESNGYMFGDYVRDKDGIAAALAAACAAARQKALGNTLADRLDRLYDEYGFYDERTESFEFPGLEGMRRLEQIIRRAREYECDCEMRTDYLSGESRCVKTGEVFPTGLPAADALEFKFSCGSSVVIRPSGTEPKLKIYYLLQARNPREFSEKYAEFSLRFREVMGL